MNKITLLLMLVICMCLLTSCKSSSSYLDNYNMYSKEDYLEKYEYLDDEDHVFISISYDELMNKLKKGETFILYLGGAWCPNCQAAAPFINNVAKEQGVVVYNFDTRNGNLEKADDLRNCLTDETKKLYGDLINALDYVNPNGTTVLVEDKYGDMHDSFIQLVKAPTIFAIKDGKSLGNVTEEFLYEEGNERLEYQNDILELIELIK